MKLFFVLLLFFTIPFQAQISKSYVVGNASREVLIFEPSQITPKMPVVFVFHGHGGNVRFASRKMDFQNYYKDALVIFMQGMPGRKVPGLDPNGKMNGWQIYKDDLGGRDLAFFDTVLNDIKAKYNIDYQKIFAVGHSNGARFVNVLWATRADQLAGIISVSAQGGEMISGAEPVSVWMYLGKKDKLVPFANQQKSIPIVKKNLNVNEKNVITKGDKTIYLGNGHTELIIQEANAGHEFPVEEIPEMVAFMKRNSK